MITKKMSDLILLLTAMATALIAGLFYAYSCSVNIGLCKLPDKEYLNAMQAINLAILNPCFFASFMGTLVLLPLTTWLNFSPAHTTRFYLLLAAAIIYIIGVFGTTMFGNVPLNEHLSRIDLQSSSVQAIADLRVGFEKPWLQFHRIRTIAAVFSLLLVLLACLETNMSKVVK